MRRDGGRYRFSALGGRPLHSPIIADFAKQEVFPFSPPQRSFAADETRAQLLYLLVQSHDAFQLRSNLLNRHDDLLIASSNGQDRATESAYSIRPIGKANTRPNGKRH